MSLMGMNRAFKKHGAIWGGILAMFIVGGIAFTSFGTNTLQNSGGRGQATALPQQSTEKPVAVVEGTPITRAELDKRLEQGLRQQAMMSGQNPPTPSPAEMDLYRAQVLESFKQEAALGIAAKANNVPATDADIAREREKIWPQVRTQFTQTLGLKPTATDAEMNAALAKQAPGLTVDVLKTKQIPDDALRQQIYRDGLTAVFKKQVKADAAEVQKSYDDIQVRHILVKFGDGIPEATAKAKAEKLLADIKADPNKMAALALQSDDPGSKTKGGFYDWSPAAKYVPEFTQAALAAGVGKVFPEIVRVSNSGYSGFHIVKLEGERPGKDFPKDWDKNKQKYLDEYVEKQAQNKAQAAVAAALPSVKVEINDPALRAAQLQNEARTAGDAKARDAKLEQALAELGKVAKTDDPLGAVPLEKATLLDQLNRPKEAIAAYEEALTSRNTAETRLALAKLYLAQKDKPNAVKQLDEVEKLAVPDLAMQYQYSQLLGQAGQKDKAKAAMDKMMEMLKRQQAQQAAQMPLTAPPTPKPSPAASGSVAASPSPAASASPVAASPAPK